jgi:hypothetical protein
MANEIVYTLGGTDQNMWEYDTTLGTEHRGMYEVGNDPVWGTCKGALRFPSITVPKGSVNYAQLRMYVEAKGSGSGATQLKTKCYGIYEDNVDFSSQPFGKTKTSDNTTRSDTMPGTGNYWSFDVTSIVSAITNRANWSSGNALGFIIEDNGSDANNWIYDDTQAKSELLIRVSAEPDFFPAPSSISAPTFPAVSNQGLKISAPGYDVRRATESQLLLTTRKKELKIIAENNTNCTAGVEKLIAHGLSYSPAHIAYVESGGYRLKLNRDFLGGTDPIANGAQGYVGSDNTNLRIIIDKTKNVYYYIFIDPL